MQAIPYSEGALVAKSEPTGRDVLLDAAGKLFLAHGYDGVSMQQIAEAAGMTKGAPYYHFENKEALFQVVFTREMARLKEEFAVQLNAEGPLRDRLCQALIRFLENTQGDMARLFSDFERFLQVKCTAEETPKMISDADITLKLAPYFADAAARGEFSRLAPERACYFFVMLAMGQLQSNRFAALDSAPPARPEDVANELVELLFEGI